MTQLTSSNSTSSINYVHHQDFLFTESMVCTLSECKSVCCGFEGVEILSYVTDSFMRQSTSMGLENC